MKLKLQTRIALLLLPLAIAISGCTTNNPGLNAALLKTAVSTAAGYELATHPAAIPAFKTAALVVCAAAHGTNVSPAEIVAAIQAQSGGMTPETVVIVNGAINLYELAYWAVSPTNSPNPYALALCEGMNEAAMIASLPASRSRNAVPQNPKWPKVVK